MNKKENVANTRQMMRFKPDDNFRNLVRLVIKEAYSDRNIELSRKEIRNKMRKSVHQMSQKVNSRKFWQSE